MTSVQRSRTVPYSCEKMYNLVNDVESYAEFLPYFSHSIVHHRDEDEVQATLVLSVGGMKKSFTTHNRLQTNKMIEIRMVDGPFSHLEGFWRFDETPEGCLISFDLEFTIAGKMLALMLGPVFEQVSDTMVDAFCDRAEDLYGKKISEGVDDQS